jgi:hypothetical protein
LLVSEENNATIVENKPQPVGRKRSTQLQDFSVQEGTPMETGRDTQ